MDPAAIAIGVAGLVTAAVTLYRARADRDTTIISGAAQAAKGIAEASAALVGPLQAALTRALERIAVLEKGLAEERAKSAECSRKMDALKLELESLRAQIEAKGGGYVD